MNALVDIIAQGSVNYEIQTNGIWRKYWNYFNCVVYRYDNLCNCNVYRCDIMRWNEPKIGDKRIKRGFLIFPKCIKCMSIS